MSLSMRIMLARINAGSTTGVRAQARLGAALRLHSVQLNPSVMCANKIIPFLGCLGNRARVLHKFEFRSRDHLDEWHFIQHYEASVTDGPLGVWDTSSLPAGAYPFRLVVVDVTGNYPLPCEVPVAIER